MAHQLPKLAFDYSDLEPYFDAKTMEIHHSKHHQTYTDKFNAALEKHPALFEKSVEHLLIHLDEVPEDIKTAVRNHGGGYYNHNLFWEILGPQKKEEPLEPADKLAEAINKKFGSYEKFKEEFVTASANLFGSGWTWLCKDSDKNLFIMPLPNQDNPLSQGLIPLMALDVWEHAYYLKYQNKRADYIEAFFHVINWKNVEKKFNS